MSRSVEELPCPIYTELGIAGPKNILTPDGTYVKEELTGIPWRMREDGKSRQTAFDTFNKYMADDLGAVAQTLGEMIRAELDGVRLDSNEDTEEETKRREAVNGVLTTSRDGRRIAYGSPTKNDNLQGEFLRDEELKVLRRGIQYHKDGKPPIPYLMPDTRNRTAESLRRELGLRLLARVAMLNGDEADPLRFIEPPRTLTPGAATVSEPGSVRELVNA